MPGLPVVLHPEAVDEAQAARIWMRNAVSPLQTRFSLNSTTASNPFQARPNADRCLSTALAAISSIDFRSGLSIESRTTVLKSSQLRMAVADRAIGRVGR